MYRIGFGIDTHPLVEGRRLVLGGIEIPFHLGLMGHSDADVLIHAVCDAILGSLSLGDLGTHFPDNEPAFKDISSVKLLDKVLGMARERKFGLCNLDSTILAERPMLKPFIQEMRKALASALNTSCENINIKAARGEGIGFVGRGEGITAYAIVLMAKIDG